ncbi:MAG: hypothetical protein Q9161_002415 [Pseudevernia consocians]
MEVVAVLGCVAALISAYKDGGNIVKQIKEKRAANKVLAPTQSLESSLERGPVAVEQAKDNGIERYGPKFATGDRSAKEDDSVTDFNILVDASDFGRIQSVNVLNELYMRMAQAAPLHKIHLPVGAAPTADPGSPPSAAPSPQVLGKSPPVPTLSDRNLPPEDQISKKDPGRSPDSTRRKWRLFPSRTRKLESEIVSESLTSGNIHESDLTDVLLGSRFGRNVLSTDLADDEIAGLPWKASSEMTIAEENPWREERSTSNGGVQKATSPIAYMQGRSTEATLVEEPPRPSQEPKPMRRLGPYKPHKQLKVETLLSGTPSEESKGTQKFPFMPGRRTTSDVSQTHQLIPTTSPIISRPQTNQSALLGSQNPYGGYCKGGYKMQVGLDKESVKLRSQSVSMTGESNYWACASSKCAFEGPACKNGKGKKWTFDDTVRVSNAVQYRWTFLAKCHVSVPKVKNGKYDYQCIFCGVQPSSYNVYRGEKAFIEHISQQHRGQQPDPSTSISDKICCIYGRVALEEESFDVNLTPIEDSPLTQQQVSVDTPDRISGFDDRNATPNEAFEWPAD